MNSIDDEPIIEVPKKNRSITKIHMLFIFLLLEVCALVVIWSLVYRNNIKKNLTLNLVPTPTPFVKPSPTPMLPVSSTPIFDTGNNKVAYVDEGEIFTINADQTDKKQITNDDYHKFGINISPDKTKIVYSFYPRDEEKRTNSGMYVGYNSGVAFVDLNSQKIFTLIPYGKIQNHYPFWNKTGDYISVWVGNGKGAKLFKKSDLSEVISISSDKGQVSPIAWVGQTSKISYVKNGILFVSDSDGGNPKEIASGVDSSREVHEGPNVPEPPFWSDDGNLVTYYKNSDLYLKNTKTNVEELVGLGGEDPIFGKYPAFYSITFLDENQMIILGYSDNDTNIFNYNLSTKKFTDLATFGQSVTISPNNKILMGQIKPAYSYSEIKFIDLGTGESNNCLPGFRHTFYTWAGGTSLQSPSYVWSPDNKLIIGNNPERPNRLMILDRTTCKAFELVTGKNIESFAWFP